jgi:uncharacterized membrane protein YqjE
MSGAAPGVLDAVAGVGSSLFGLLQNRLELAGLELGEARDRFVFTLIASIAALLLLGGAVLAFSAWIAAVLWPALGPAVLGWIALAYTLAAAGFVWWLRSSLRNDPPLLADTLAELRADAAALRSDPPRA